MFSFSLVSFKTWVTNTCCLKNYHLSSRLDYFTIIVLPFSYKIDADFNSVVLTVYFYEYAWETK